MRPDRGLFDEGGKPDAAMDAAAAQLLLLAAQPVVVHQLHEPRMTAIERRVGAHDAATALPRSIGVVAPPQLRRIKAQPSRRKIDQLLGHGTGERMPDRAQDPAGRLVLEPAEGTAAKILEPIWRRGQMDGLQGVADIA